MIIFSCIIAMLVAIIMIPVVIGTIKEFRLKEKLIKSELNRIHLLKSKYHGKRKRNCNV